MYFWSEIRERDMAKKIQLWTIWNI